MVMSTPSYHSEKFSLTKTLRDLLVQVGIKNSKRDGYLSVQGEYSIYQSNLCWDGGSRTEMTIVSCEGGTLRVIDAESVRQVAGSPFKPGCEQFVSSLPPHLLVIETGHSCGKEVRPHFYVGHGSQWFRYFPVGLILTARTGSDRLALPAAQPA